MIYLRLALFALLTYSFSFGLNAQNSNDAEHVLQYDKPAGAWEERLPVGNGRMGMMPDGNPISEFVVLNEISLWSGCEWDYANPDAAESLKDIRAALLQGKNVEAQKIMYERFVPKKDTDGGTYGTYQVLGGLMLNHRYADETQPTDYRRWLDLRQASAYSTYNVGEVGYTKRYYVSRTDDVMVVELSASEAGAISVDVQLDRAGKAALSFISDGVMKMQGHLESGSEKPGMGYCAYAKVFADGENATVKNTSSDSPHIKVEGADRVWVVISAATDFWGENPEVAALDILNRVKGRGLYKMHDRSVASHQELYHRAGLSIDSEYDADSLTTDKRLVNYANGSADNAFASLYYNYGRYLLICSTRPGGLPPNLQGLWANTFATPWNGDYHTNINVQMNHWIAECGNLSELHMPLVDLVQRLVPSGRKTAKDFYGPQAKGWVQHMMTNVWNYTAPGEHPSWGATNTGGAWLCAHLWEHYIYGGDKKYLQEVYPTLKGASEFFLSTMIKEPKNGWLVTAPSSSPENTFYATDENGKLHPTSICMGPTMDSQLIRELFTNTISAAEILGKDEAFVDSLKNAVAFLPPNKIAEGGYLMEWLEDYKETDPRHRHISHLYGLHPGCEISPFRTPELAKACEVTLNIRGDQATGWSRAWKINFWARIGDGNRALKLLRSLFAPASYRGHGPDFCKYSGSYPNLLCAHPPFQIDGNFGGAAGISEMLIQSSDGFINLLPALPDQWAEGSLYGFKVRTGAIVDLVWSDGLPVEMTVKGGWKKEIKVLVPEGLDAYINGKKTILDEGKWLVLNLCKAKKVSILFKKA